jgi:hypothetical protein
LRLTHSQVIILADGGKTLYFDDDCDVGGTTDSVLLLAHSNYTIQVRQDGYLSTVAVNVGCATGAAFTASNFLCDLNLSYSVLFVPTSITILASTGDAFEVSFGPFSPGSFSTKLLPDSNYTVVVQNNEYSAVVASGISCTHPAYVSNKGGFSTPNPQANLDVFLCPYTINYAHIYDVSVSH